MAVTRFYFQRDVSSDINPALSATWNVFPTPAHDTYELDLSNDQTSYGGEACTETSATNPYYVAPGRCQWASLAQSAYEWTTADSIKAQVNAWNQTGAGLFYVYCVIRVVDNAGTTFRGTLFEGAWGTLISAVDWYNRSIAGGAGGHVHVQNAVSMQANDRILVEMGVKATNTTTDSCVGNLYIGSGKGTDLPESETGTTFYNPWIEFTTADAATNIMLNII